MRGFRIFFSGGWSLMDNSICQGGPRPIFGEIATWILYICIFRGGGRTLPLQTCFLCMIFSSTETHCNISICHYNRKIKLYSYNMNFLMSFLEQRFIFQNMIRIKNFTVNFNGGMYYEMYLNNILYFIIYLSLHIWVMMEHSKLCWQCVGINGTSYKKYSGSADKGNL